MHDAAGVKPPRGAFVDVEVLQWRWRMGPMRIRRFLARQGVQVVRIGGRPAVAARDVVSPRRISPHAPGNRRRTG